MVQHLQVRSEGESLGIFSFQFSSAPNQGLIKDYSDGRVVSNPTLLSNGSDVVQCWDGCCSCSGADIFLISSTPTQPCYVMDRKWLSVGMDVALVLGPAIL